MAIEDILTPTIVEVGAIRIGTLGEERKARGGNSTYRLPQKLDHFIVTTKYRDKNKILVQDAAVMESLRANHADPDGEIRKIPIALLSDDISDSLHASYVCYKGKQCLARSDGKELIVYGDFTTGNMFSEPKIQPWTKELEEKEFKGKRVFKPHSTFDVVIALAESRFGGVYKFRSGSRISGEQLYGSLCHISALTGGVLVGMPLNLVVRPLQVNPEGIGPTTVHVVHVELHGADLQTLQEKALKIAEFQKDHRIQIGSMRKQMRTLTYEPGDPSYENDELVAELQQEFHPEVEQEEIDTSANVKMILNGLLASLDIDEDGRDTIASKHIGKTFVEVCESEELMKELISKLNQKGEGDE